MWRAVQNVVMEHTMVEDHAPYFGSLWEPNEHTSQCHGCLKHFTPPIVTKHHCRGCAWIFCNDCAAARPTVSSCVTRSAAEFIGSHGHKGKIPDASKLEPELRMCLMCFRGETPGWTLRKRIMETLSAKKAAKKISALADKHRASKQASQTDIVEHAEEALHKVENALGFGDNQSSSGNGLELTREGFADSDFGDAKPAPRSGHFEFLNKTDEVCAIKVTLMKRSENEERQIVDDGARPFYTALEPGEEVSASFDATVPENHLAVHVLYGNPFPKPRGHIARDTRTANSADDIAACANIANFERLASFRMHPFNKNCIVKLKGASSSKDSKGAAESVDRDKPKADVSLEPREGSSIGRVGIMNWVNNVRTVKDQNSIDFDTNIDRCRLAASFV